MGWGSVSRDIDAGNTQRTSCSSARSSECIAALPLNKLNLRSPHVLQKSRSVCWSATVAQAAKATTSGSQPKPLQTTCHAQAWPWSRHICIQGIQNVFNGPQQRLLNKLDSNVCMQRGHGSELGECLDTSVPLSVEGNGTGGKGRGYDILYGYAYLYNLGV